MTLAQITALIASNIDTTGRRLTTGVKMRSVLNAIVAYLSDGPQVKTVRLPLSSAQILTGNSNPVPFGITAPRGYFIQPISCSVSYTYNGVVYTGNFRIAVRTVGGSTSLFDFGNILAVTSSLFVNAIPKAGSVIAASDLEAYVESGDPADGNSTAIIYLTYAEIPI